MKILALEFSSTLRSVATVESRPGLPPVLLGEAVCGTTGLGDGGTQGRRDPGTKRPRTLAFALIAEALGQARLEREEIDCLAVGLGPGSYTGIRVAISIAQGWQLAKSVRLLGVSSIEALALEAQKQSLRGTVHLVIDAHRNEFYLATYEIGDKDVRAKIPLCLTSLADARARAQTGGVLAGPGVQPWFPGSQPLFPHASMLGRLAAARDDYLSGEKLEPIYLRPTRFVKAAPPRVIPSV